MVWLHGRSYWARVYRDATDTEGTKVRLYTNEPRYARSIEQTLDRLRRKGSYFDVLAAVADGTRTAGQLDEAYRADPSLAAFRAQLTAVDLSPLVERWGGKGRRGAMSAKYVRQVRTLLHEDEAFPASDFTRGTVARWLAALPVTDVTRARYKAAVLQFAQWLVEQEVLPANPLRDLAGYPASRARLRWFTPTEASLVIATLPGEAAFVSAFMAMTGVEWGALAAAYRRDVDLAALTFRARGTKHAPGRRNWRDRTVEILDVRQHREWRPVWLVLEPLLRAMTPNAKLVTISGGTAIRHLTAALRRLKLPHHTLHDWRHTYAVNAIQRGDDEQAIKRQLGHAPTSTLLHTTYGVYLDEAKAARDRAPARRHRLSTRTHAREG